MKGIHIGEFEELVLLMVTILSEAAYVFRIQQELRNQLNRSASMGALHATLTRLENKGLLKSNMAGASSKRGGRRKRVYGISAAGTKVLNEVKEMRSMLWNQVPSYALKISYA